MAGQLDERSQAIAVKRDRTGEECARNQQRDTPGDPTEALCQRLAVIADGQTVEEEKLPGRQIENAVVGDRPG